MISSARLPRYPASAHKCLLRRWGGLFRLTMMACNTWSSCVTSCSFAPVTTSDNGTPRPSTNKCLLLPFFSPVRRVSPHSLLRQGRFEHGSIDALPSPCDAFHLVILGKPCLPDRFEYSCGLPFQKALVDRTGAAESLLGECLPLAACAKDVHDRLEYLPCWLGRSARTSLAHVLFCRWTLTHRNQWFDALPKVISHHPRLNSLSCCHAFTPSRVRCGLEQHFTIYG